MDSWLYGLKCGLLLGQLGEIQLNLLYLLGLFQCCQYKMGA